jgi:tight adherence protein C
MTLETVLVALLAGAALTMAAMAIGRLVIELGGAETIYRDRPPTGFRWLWPAVNVFANTFAFLLTRDREAALLARLRRAGQEYALTPHQFFGGKLVGALLGVLVGWGLAGEGTALFGMVLGGLFGFVYPDIWLRDHTQARNLAILKALPFFLDIVTLSIESGLNLTGALQKAVDKCKPSPLMVEINRVLRDVRAGKPRLEALRDLADRLDYAPISSLVSALVQGELMGSSLGPILRAQSDQRRTERFQRAEKLAMEAPVKMLGPLIMFIFPCTFVVIGFPIVVKFMASGL